MSEMRRPVSLSMDERLRKGLRQRGWCERVYIRRERTTKAIECCGCQARKDRDSGGVGARESNKEANIEGVRGLGRERYLYDPRRLAVGLGRY